MDLTGKNVVVTGGANGVGKAVCLSLAKAGAACAVVDLNAEASSIAVADIEAAGGRAAAIIGDITRKEGADALFDQAVAAFGHIDGLVNSAGIYPRSPLLEISDEAWDSNFAVNLRGLYHMSVAAVLHMRGRGGGRIVNVSSVAGLKPHPGNAHYACMKAGVISLTKSFGLEFAKDKVLVNGIAPGWIATDKAKEAGNIFQPWALAEMPIGRAAEPAEIADLILFLLSDHNTYLVGETVTISGGTYIS
ncbi:SDR family NAD(P)-dependent oxidoreductase [Labrys wisconsinensis]|uniref:NAD(P)-dependent dehydrogenase (Short-subunit alcohol dehydrogenase family) n=1 Tax=Labrys wisconsinensis TaxID=425677 RepID=A0ABU0JG37_9HYPH|nr:SDR family NAD(P)-dependent oxidoreductase [Labrys wisconsinensis]MDQ0472097.1 NAD(P)-dependent dehydrogenase (short-subunit alcohol dehydrogenase family) [Labrys wisconsinensis]